MSLAPFTKALYVAFQSNIMKNEVHQGLPLRVCFPILWFSITNITTLSSGMALNLGETESVLASSQDPNHPIDGF